MAALQLNRVAIQAVTMGASTPPMLPHRFIQPDTEPLYWPPMSRQAAQEALKVRPRDPSDRLIHRTFCQGTVATAPRYRVTQQRTRPTLPKVVRAWNFDIPAATILSATTPVPMVVMNRASQGSEAAKPIFARENFCASIR